LKVSPASSTSAPHSTPLNQQPTIITINTNTADAIAITTDGVNITTATTTDTIALGLTMAAIHDSCGVAALDERSVTDNVGNDHHQHKHA